jgi:hypothetical protein
VSKSAIEGEHSMFRASIIRILCAGFMVLGGCVVVPAEHVRYVEARIAIAPPPPRVEVIPAAPASHWYWVGGHWKWEGGGYQWVGGHWVEPRPGEVFVQAFWTREGGGWEFHPAQWRPIQQTAGAVIVTAPKPPPPLRVEIVAASPGPDYFWINGHWAWERGDHVWVSGRWEAHRPDWTWVPAHWVRSGPAWQLVGGHWQRLR